MFTWICPKCGREVPPSYDECPDCARAVETGPTPAAAEPLSPEEQRLRQLGLGGAGNETPQPVPLPAQPAPAQPGMPMHRETPPRQRGGGPPVWLMTILFAFAFVGIGSGIYWLVGYLRSNPPGRPPSAVESPAAKSGGKTSPLQKYIEVSGVRFIEDSKKRPQVRFVVVNHSAAEIDGLAGNVTIWGRTQKSEEDAAGTFTFATNLGPWESKDMTAPLNSKLKIYELPDWQNVSTDIQITAPAASAGSGAPR